MFYYHSLFKQLLKLLICLFILSLNNHLFADEPKKLRIGYQPYGTLILVKGRGQLANKLASLNTTVEWVEFKTGMSMLDAFGQGKLDFIVVGEVPPVFIQSAQIPFVYVGYEPPSPSSVAIVVPKHSAISKITELKNKKIAFAKGTNVHYLVLKTLEKARLAEDEVQIVYLLPDQGRIALENNEIDAWAIWDPFLASAQQELDVRTLIDGQGLVPSYQFYLARRDYVEQHSQVIDLMFEEISRIGIGIQQNPVIIARFLAPRIGLSTTALEIALKRMSTGIQLMDTEVIEAQQQLANLFHRKGLIQKISLKEVLWKLQGEKSVDN